MCNLVDSKIHSVLPTVCSLLTDVVLRTFWTNIQGWARIPEIKPTRD